MKKNIIFFSLCLLVSNSLFADFYDLLNNKFNAITAGLVSIKQQYDFSKRSRLLETHSDSPYDFSIVLNQNKDPENPQSRAKAKNRQSIEFNQEGARFVFDNNQSEDLNYWSFLLGYRLYKRLFPNVKGSICYEIPEKIEDPRNKTAQNYTRENKKFGRINHLHLVGDMPKNVVNKDKVNDHLLNMTIREMLRNRIDIVRVLPSNEVESKFYKNHGFKDGDCGFLELSLKDKRFTDYDKRSNEPLR